MVFVTRCLTYLLRRIRYVATTLFFLALLVLGVQFSISNQTNAWVNRYLISSGHGIQRLADDPAGERLLASKQMIWLSMNSDTYPRSFYDDIRNVSQGRVTDQAEVTDSCIFPNIDPFDPVMMGLNKFHPPLSCEGGVPHLVYVNGDTITVNNSRITSVNRGRMYPFKECRYKTLGKAPGSDFETVVLFTSEVFTDNITLRDSDDNFVVECSDSNTTVLSRSYFSLIRVKKDIELILEDTYKKHVTLNSPKEVLNILMIGMDGNSKQNLQRHMPKTRNYLLNVLNAIELHKYNRIAEDTYSNLVLLLAGKTWQELHRSNWTFMDYFDFVNEDFLWSDFRKVGYRTGIFFDDSFVTAFHFYKKGWDKPPADYYMRATILDRERDKLMRSKGTHCVGDVPEIALNLDFWLQMTSTFNNSKTRPYFGFSFSTRLTHDDHNLASAGDHLYLNFFQELKDKNLIDNTVIIFFSDHGQRFGKTRATYNGMIESKNPYMFLVFPPWFRRKYPELMKVLKINQERLTTNVDIYETLRDLINFQAKSGLGDLDKKAISLFQEIPRQRSCQHTRINTGHCVCDQMAAANVTSVIAVHLAETLEEKLRSLVRPFKDKCQQLTYKYIQNVLRINTGQVVENELDKDVSLYQITITTEPGEGLYEANLKFSNATKRSEVFGDIRRINMYRGQVECIENTKLRPYCYCYKQKR